MKTVIEMAREAAGDDWKLFQDFLPEIHRLAELVRADEREACAKVCEETEKIKRWDDYIDGCQDCASAILARGNT